MKDGSLLTNMVQRVRSRSRTRSRSNSNSSTGSGSGKHHHQIARNHGEFKILVLGELGVGKTSICRTYVGLSKDDDDISLTNEDVPYDTAICVDWENEVRQYDLEIYVDKHNSTCIEQRKEVEMCDGFLMVYSKTSKQSLMKLLDWKADIIRIKSSSAKHGGSGSAGKTRDCRPPMIAVGNKSNLNDHSIQLEDIWSLDLLNIDVCAEHNEGLQTAFKALVKLCIQDHEDRLL